MQLHTMKPVQCHVDSEFENHSSLRKFSISGSLYSISIWPARISSVVMGLGTPLVPGTCAPSGDSQRQCIFSLPCLRRWSHDCQSIIIVIQARKQSLRYPQHNVIHRLFVDQILLQSGLVIRDCRQMSNVKIMTSVIVKANLMPYQYSRDVSFCNSSFYSLILTCRIGHY